MMMRVLDSIALATFVLIAWKTFSDNTRAGIFGFAPFVKTSFLLYALAGLLVVRQIAFPHPHALATCRGAWQRISAAPMWGPAVRAFCSTRLMVFVVAFFAVVAIGMNKPGVVLSSHPLTNLPMRFDAGWYGGIAMHGYDPLVNFTRQRNIAFFPAMPMAMRALGPVFGTAERGVPEERRMARFLWTGVVISLVSFLLALHYLMRLGTLVVGEERAAAALFLLAAYPFACFFNAPYAESLFLLGIVATAFHFMRGQFGRAAAWGLVVGLTRPNGFLLCVPLGLLALQQLRAAPVPEASSAPRRPLRALAAAAAPVAGMLAFTGYLYWLTGAWFAWQRNHAAWGRSYNGFEPMVRGFGRLNGEGLIQAATNIPFDVLNTAAAVFAILMIWPVWRRIGAAWGIYVVITMIPPMFAGGALSLGRLTSTLFPVFLALAAILPARAVPSWTTAFAILQGLCAVLFFTWRELF